MSESPVSWPYIIVTITSIFLEMFRSAQKKLQSDSCYHQLFVCNIWLYIFQTRSINNKKIFAQMNKIWLQTTDHFDDCLFECQPSFFLPCSSHSFLRLLRQQLDNFLEFIFGRVHVRKMLIFYRAVIRRVQFL